MKDYKIVVPGLYVDLLKQKHLLIGGATGSGKSVIINGIIRAGIVTNPRNSFIFLDPKRVELSEYRRLVQCYMHVSELRDMTRALDTALTITDKRYREMSRRGLRMWDKEHMYIVIDELADLMTTRRKEVQPQIQRLCQIGRAAGIHVIAATQTPISKVIPTEIKVNFDSRIALHCVTKQDSRNIIGVPGAESLPQYGYAYYMTSSGIDKVRVPIFEIPPDIMKRNKRLW